MISRIARAGCFCFSPLFFLPSFLFCPRFCFFPVLFPQCCPREDCLLSTTFPLTSCPCILRQAFCLAPSIPLRPTMGPADGAGWYFALRGLIVAFVCFVFFSGPPSSGRVFFLFLSYFSHAAPWLTWMASVTATAFLSGARPWQTLWSRPLSTACTVNSAHVFCFSRWPGQLSIFVLPHPPRSGFPWCPPSWRHLLRGRAGHGLMLARWTVWPLATGSKASLAQLVEHALCKRTVMGSSPIGGSYSRRVKDDAWWYLALRGL